MDKRKHSELVDHIGVPAMLEQTAEEAMELAFVCLKMARMIRNENPVHGRRMKDLVENLEEEVADVCLCFDEMNSGGIIRGGQTNDWYDKKRERMAQRLKEADNEQ